MSKHSEVVLFNNLIQQLIGNYIVNATSYTADTIGDTRSGTISGWKVEETCTVANATKFSGTWVATSAIRTISLVDNNMQYEAEDPYRPFTANASIPLRVGKSGFGKVIIGDNQEYAKFTFKSDGTVTLLTDISTNVVTTATDGKLCIYDGGTQIFIINELGSTLIATVIINYNS